MFVSSFFALNFHFLLINLKNKNVLLSFGLSQVCCFSFRHYINTRPDVTKSLRASVTSPGGFAVRSPFRDFVHLKVLQNAKHFAKPPGVVCQHTKANAEIGTFGFCRHTGQTQKTKRAYFFAHARTE